jgi:hypothetical protein
MNTPSVGRIVHYVNEDGKHRAAVITDVNDTVELLVLNQGGVTGATADYSEAHLPGTWHWPERV